MKAKDLAKILLEHPNFEVCVGIQKYISQCREYGYEYTDISDDMIEIDNETIFLGKDED